MVQLYSFPTQDLPVTPQFCNPFVKETKYFGTLTQGNGIMGV